MATAGDLRQFATAVTEALRLSDHGLLPEATAAALIEVADRCRDAIVDDARSRSARVELASEAAERDSLHVLPPPLPGRTLKSEPDEQASYQRCYYDDQGELCLCEAMALYQRRGHAARMRAFQQIVRLQVAGQIVQLQLDTSYAEGALTVSNIAFPTFEDGHLIRLVTYFAETRIGGHVDSRYDYSSDGPIARHDVRVAGNGRRRAFEYDASYAESKLARVSYRELEPGSASGGEGIVLFRAAPSAGVRAAARTARDSLVAGARKWALANAPSDQQSYCLALLYNDTDPLLLPPALALGTVGHLKSTGGDPRLVWNPAEFSIFATDPEEILSAEARDAYAVLNRAWHETENHEAQRKLLVAVAKELDKTDWSAIAFEDRFVVYAVDLDLRDLPKNQRASVDKAALSSILDAARGLRSGHERS